MSDDNDAGKKRPDADRKRIPIALDPQREAVKRNVLQIWPYCDNAEPRRFGKPLRTRRRSKPDAPHDSL